MKRSVDPISTLAPLFLLSHFMCQCSTPYSHCSHSGSAGSCTAHRSLPALRLTASVPGLFTGVCTNNTAPSVSSINRILRNRAAERAAAEFARAAGYGFYHPYASALPYPPAVWPSLSTPSPATGGGLTVTPPAGDTASSASSTSPKPSLDGEFGSSGSSRESGGWVHLEEFREVW